MIRFSGIALLVAALAVPAFAQADNGNQTNSANDKSTGGLSLPKMKMGNLLNKANKKMQAKESQDDDNPLSSTPEEKPMRLDPPKPKDKDKKKSGEHKAQASSESKQQDTDDSSGD